MPPPEKYVTVVPVGRRCGDRNPSTGMQCRMGQGHDGDHAFYWARLPVNGTVGRVRETWPNR